MSNMAGLIGPADRYSKVGIVAGLTLFFGLVLADLVAWGFAGEVFVLTHFHSLALVAIVLLTLGSLMVHLAARVIRWLRRLSARFDAIDDAMVGETPSPETVAAVRRLAFQVVHSRD